MAADRAHRRTVLEHSRIGLLWLERCATVAGRCVGSARAIGAPGRIENGAHRPRAAPHCRAHVVDGLSDSVWRLGMAARPDELSGWRRRYGGRLRPADLD